MKETGKLYLIPASLGEGDFTKAFDEVSFHLLNKHTNEGEIGNYLNSNLKGEDTGLLSEAGLPCVADPGASIVRLAHKKNIRVIPLIGPSSIFLALMASGFNGQHFAFKGYLPIDKNARERKIKELESDVYKKDQTQIFIETPYRNMRVFDALLKICSDESMLCIACDVSLETEFIKTLRVKDWRKQIPELHKRPAVFLLYK